MADKKGLTYKAAQIRCSDFAQQKILLLAKQLHNKYPKEHALIGLKIPSSRMAIDYLLYLAARNSNFRISKLTPENNIYLRLDISRAED